MKNCWIAILALVLFACDSASEKTSTETSDTTSGTTTESPVEALQITQADLPKSFTYKGIPQDVWKWTDNSGENIFFTTVVAPFPDNDKGEHGEDGLTSELYAFHYIKKDGEYEIAWQMKDGELSCPLDIVSEFIKGSATVTDLDKDGIAETKVQYALACHGDVSPSSMKLIMQENKEVYTLQGSRWIEYSPGLKFDVNASNVNLEKLPKSADTDPVLQSLGRYESEKTFEGAPPQFLEYARNEWLKFVIQK